MRRPRVDHLRHRVGTEKEGVTVTSDYTAIVRRVYAAMQERDPQVLASFVEDIDLQDDELLVVEAALKGHLIKDQWEYIVQRPLPNETGIQNDEFFWADFAATVFTFFNGAQHKYQRGLPEESRPPIVQALTLLEKKYREATADTEKLFVQFYDFILLLKRFYQAIEEKYQQETNQEISAEQFYEAATHYSFTAFLLEWMQNDQPAGLGLEKMALINPSAFRALDSKIDLATLERDPKTNVVTYSPQYIDRVGEYMKDGVISAAEMQVSCPVMHTNLIHAMTEWMASVAVHYRFGVPLPPSIPSGKDVNRTAEVLKHYQVLMSAEYKAARGIID